MSETVLFVDDEPVILGFAESLFAGKGLQICTCASAREALKILEKESVAVLVSDNCMPEMGGLELLSRTTRISPDTVKIMMTAYADLPTTMAAINKSEVYRFIIKPWGKKEMLRAVKEGVRRYRLLQSLKREDDHLLHSLAQTIELKDPLTKGHCDRVATYAIQLAQALNLPKEMQVEIKYGSWLHDCGKIGVPEALLNAPRGLTPEELDIVKKHPAWGLEVVRKANLSMVVQNIVMCHHERYDGKGYPAGLAGKDIPLEARIVAVADIYDALLSDRPYRPGYSQERTLEMVIEMKGSFLDPSLVDIFSQFIASGRVGVALEAA